VIDRQAQLAANNPAMIGDTRRNPGFRISPITDRMNQFNAVTVNNAQQTGLGKESLRPFPMRLRRNRRVRSGKSGS